MSDISAFGITARLPPGWDGRINRRPGPTATAGPQIDTRAAPDAGSRSAPPSTTATTAPPPGDDEATENPVAHLATFPLPPNRGDYGSGAVELMRGEDVLVCLVEFDPEAAATPLFASSGVPRFALSDFAPHTMQRTIAGMCGAQAFFNEAGRAFAVYAVLGSYRLRAPLVARVNALLAGLRIEPA